MARLWAVFARALDVLDCLHPIVGAAACFTLRYANCESAAVSLREAFGGALGKRRAA